MMLKDTLTELLEHYDIKINGSRPYDPQIEDNRFYKEVLSRGSLGLGESYMQGWWNANDVEELLYRLIQGDIAHQFKTKPVIWWHYIRSKALNLQSKKRSIAVALKHYNIGNELYTYMLGKTMMYSCAYWREADNLDAAQEAKLDLICKKLNLSPGQRVLDIGCGWGGFAKFAAEKYGVEVVGVSIAEEQVDFARKWCMGLPVDFRLQDYRDLNEKFDRIVSIGMFEHVGHKNYDNYMNIVHQNLKDDGLFLLHCIGGNESTTATDPWIHKYIFPNGLIPSPSQLAKAIEPYFIMEDWHNFGLDYEATLNAWQENFKQHWNQLKEHYDRAFYRMWLYYLNVSAASFKAKHNNVWQVVLAKKGNTLPYSSVR
ncbi:cyclopropane fatty acyl phospholipid synthase [Olivibacter ginsenosidimutans]|uniref:Cyclopropane fatty acyl phospholipid synthase n=1 Tax=Olivibacter ginsenosidimutans TaxID=1176537 RepID=A0ABP9ADF7_9SPHI